MQLVREKQEEEQATDRPSLLKNEAQKIERELENFMRLIASGDTPESILNEVTQREERLKSLKPELLDVTTSVHNEIDANKLNEVLTARASDFKTLIYSDTVKAKNALKQLLDGPLIILPAEDGWRFEGKTRIGNILDSGYTNLASRRGVLGASLRLALRAVAMRRSILFPTKLSNC